MTLIRVPESPVPRSRVYAMLVVTMLLWSGNAIVARAIHADVPPFTLALLRWSGAAAIAVPLAWRRIAGDWPVVRARWPMILLLGLIGVGSFNALLYSGLQSTTAGNALLIQAGIPAAVLTLDLIFFRVVPRWAQVLGTAMAVLGVLTIIFKGDPQAMMSLRFGHGDALIVCAVAAWAVYTCLLRLRPPIHALSFLALTFLVGVATMIPFAVHEWGHARINLTPPVAAGVAYIAVFPSLIAYMLWNRAVEEIGGGEAGQAISLQPLFGALLASLLLGEALHFHHLVGMVLILLGIAAPIALRPRTREPSAH